MNERRELTERHRELALALEGESGANLAKDERELVLDAPRGKAKGAHAELGETEVPLCVESEPGAVDGAVDLESEASRGSEEVDDVAPEDDLTTEADAESA